MASLTSSFQRSLLACCHSTVCLLALLQVATSMSTGSSTAFYTSTEGGGLLNLIIIGGVILSGVVLLVILFYCFWPEETKASSSTALKATTSGKWRGMSQKHLPKMVIDGAAMNGGCAIPSPQDSVVTKFDSCKVAEMMADTPTLKESNAVSADKPMQPDVAVKSNVQMTAPPPPVTTDNQSTLSDFGTCLAEANPALLPAEKPPTPSGKSTVEDETPSKMVIKSTPEFKVSLTSEPLKSNRPDKVVSSKVYLTSLHVDPPLAKESSSEQVNPMASGGSSLVQLPTPKSELKSNSKESTKTTDVPKVDQAAAVVPVIAPPTDVIKQAAPVSVPVVVPIKSKSIPKLVMSSADTELSFKSTLSGSLSAPVKLTRAVTATEAIAAKPHADGTKLEVIRSSELNLSGSNSSSSVLSGTGSSVLSEPSCLKGMPSHSTSSIVSETSSSAKSKH